MHLFWKQGTICTKSVIRSAEKYIVMWKSGLCKTFTFSFKKLSLLIENRQEGGS